MLNNSLSLQGVRFHVPAQFRDNLSSNPPRYAFAVTTGHSGTTSLSREDSH